MTFAGVLDSPAPGPLKDTSSRFSCHASWCVIDLLITYDLEGWAYHGRALALARHAPADFRVRIAQLNTHGRDPADHAAIRDSVLGDRAPDLIFVLCYHQAKGVRLAIQKRGWHTRLIVSWNNGWPSREADFQKIFAHADAVLINNREYWERAGMPARSVVIANGVDLTTFRLSRPIEPRQPRVIWCGSEYHRQLKGYDELIVPLFSRLREDQIDCEALLVDSQRADKRSPQEMAEWYNTATVLVVASETEGTPNPALEAAACGCTLVSTRVGNMPELIRDGENGFLVDRDLESLLEGVRRAVASHSSLATQLHHDIQSWGWTSRASNFFEVFRAVVAGQEGLTTPA
jgi:glycosyltransferase involved in cell wall biosynthesis